MISPYNQHSDVLSYNIWLCKTSFYPPHNTERQSHLSDGQDDKLPAPDGSMIVIWLKPD